MSPLLCQLSYAATLADTPTDWATLSRRGVLWQTGEMLRIGRRVRRSGRVLIPWERSHRGCDQAAPTLRRGCDRGGEQVRMAVPRHRSASLRGRLVAASQNLGDPNFFRTVVLILEHGEGVLGVVLNRPTTVTIEQAAPKWSELNQRPEGDLQWWAGRTHGGDRAGEAFGDRSAAGGVHATLGTVRDG